MKQINFEFNDYDQSVYNVKPKNVNIDAGGASLFVHVNNEEYGYKFIPLKRQKIKTVWFSKNHPNEFLLNKTNRILYANYSNFLADFNLVPKVYGFKSLMINNFYVTGIVTEKLKVIRKKVDILSPEIIFLTTQFTEINKLYNLYSNKNTLDLFDFGEKNFGYDKNNHVKFLDLEWEAFFKDLKPKIKNQFLKSNSLGEISIK